MAGTWGDFATAAVSGTFLASISGSQRLVVDGPQDRIKHKLK
jgi:hypothetical protein